MALFLLLANLLLYILANPFHTKVVFKEEAFYKKFLLLHGNIYAKSTPSSDKKNTNLKKGIQVYYSVVLFCSEAQN